MGFLSAYSGTERVEVGERDDGTLYWVEVKKCLSREESEIAEKLLSSSTTTRDKTGERTTTTSSYRTYVVCASIVAWNLDDDDGTVWPHNNDAAIRRGVLRLPDPVFQRVFQHVDESNNPLEDPAKRRDFRHQGDDGDQVGETSGRPGQPADARPGDVAVAAPGPALG